MCSEYRIIHAALRDVGKGGKASIEDFTTERERERERERRQGR